MNIATNMLNFVKINKESLLNCLANVTQTMPTAVNGVDFRSEISHRYCRALVRAFPNALEAVYDKEHDLVYCPTNEKISMKSQKEKIFQRQAKRSKDGQLTRPCSIMFINTMGKNDHTTDKLEKVLSNISWLLTIQRGSVEEPIVGFGLISGTRLKSLMGDFSHRTDDQVKLVIPNDEYDYFSGLREITITTDPVEQAIRNQVFYTSKE